MASRPTVTVLGADGKATGATEVLPKVFSAPIRPDIVKHVHTGMAKNKRQPYSVSEKAGHQTSAESWGTGESNSLWVVGIGGAREREGEGNMGLGGRWRRENEEHHARRKREWGGEGEYRQKVECGMLIEDEI